MEDRLGCVAMTFVGSAPWYPENERIGSYILSDGIDPGGRVGKSILILPPPVPAPSIGMISRRLLDHDAVPLRLEH